MFKYYLAIFFFSCILSCKNESSNKLVRIVNNDSTIVGTIKDDTIKYYDNENRLLGFETYENQKINGVSIKYYPSGVIKEITEYENGLKNGRSITFDSLSNKIFEEYSYYDLLVGPCIYYKEGIPEKYYFTNLENETLFKIDYNSWKGVKDIAGKCISKSALYEIADNGQGRIKLLLYLMNPPKFNFKFFIQKKENEVFELIEEVQEIKPFKNIELPFKNGDEYRIHLEIFDSLLNKKSVVYQDL